MSTKELFVFTLLRLLRKFETYPGNYCKIWKNV